MDTTKIMFSVNRYDRDGDIVETGIFLHFGDTIVKAADTLADFRRLPDHIESMAEEIAENYPLSD